MWKTHNIWWQIQMRHGIYCGPAVITRQPLSLNVVPMGYLLYISSILIFRIHVFFDVLLFYGTHDKASHRYGNSHLT